MPTSSAPLAAGGQLGGGAAGIFYGQLAGVLRAGMPLPRALRTLAQDALGRRFRRSLDRAAERMENGEAPAAAFEEEAAQLGGALARVVAASAGTDKLPALLSDLSRLALTGDRIQRRIADALMYPFSVVFLTSLLNTSFGTIKYFRGDTFYNPDDLELYSGHGILFSYLFDMALPANVAVLVIILVLMLWKALARVSPMLRRLREKAGVVLPMTGAVCRPLALARFCGGVAILLKAGMPYHLAVAAAGPLAGFAPYEKAASRAAEILEAGGSQEEAWDDHLFSGSFRFLLAAALVRGELPQAFQELSELYAQEAENRGRLLAIMAPPACLIVTGLLLGLNIGFFFRNMYFALSWLSRF
jgi:type II secretory pathway component PulF